MIGASEIIWSNSHSPKPNISISVSNCTLKLDNRKKDKVWFVLLCFYGISTIVGYLMPN